MSQSTPWNADQIPELGGRTIIVTGANSGIGYQAALQLARRGAHVVLACRNTAKAQEAIGAIRSLHAGASLEALELDLADLSSIRSFAKAFLEKHTALDVLCNNAGVMALPQRKTLDGFEAQLGTNHLGHFALTGLLLERLLATPQARVVTVSSTAHRPGRMRFEDLQSERSYGKWRAYSQSKLANLLFCRELQRRLEAAQQSVISLACHPGYSDTNLQFAGPRMQGSSFMEGVMKLGNRLLSQGADMGALPTLYAAVSPDARGGDYIGPDGFMETKGHPTRVGSSARSQDPETAGRLWEISETLTGVRYEALARPA